MQLTRHTDYSLRILMYLAINEGQRTTLPEIADAFGISLNHLTKVLQGLTGMGVVQTFRGKRGGVALAHLPANIRVGDVVRRQESNLEIVDCANPPCPIVPVCGLKGALNRARDAFLDELDQYTLADLIDRRQANLRRLLIA